MTITKEERLERLYASMLKHGYLRERTRKRRRRAPVGMVVFFFVVVLLWILFSIDWNGDGSVEEETIIPSEIEV